MAGISSWSEPALAQAERQERQTTSPAPVGLQEFVEGLAKFFGSRDLAQWEWLAEERVRWEWHRNGSGTLPPPQSFTANGRNPRQLPLPDSACQTVFNLGSLGTLSDAALETWLPELRRVVGRNLWITVEKTPTRDRIWWEQRFLAAGFRKHPLSPVLIPFDDSADSAEVLGLIFEKIPDAALARHSLAALQAERDLHMDMLREPGLRSEAHLARYALARRHVREGAMVLDAACGLGYGSAILAAGTGVARILGLDSDAWAIDYARLHYASTDSPLEFRQADVSDLSFLQDASVDLVVSFETLEHLPNPDRALREFARVLKPGGVFIGSVPNLWVDEQGRNPVPYHLHIYDFALFHDQVARWFQWRELYRQNAAGGWKRAQPRRLCRIPTLRPSPEDQRDAEWWLCVAEKSAGSSRPRGSGRVEPVAAGQVCIPADSGSRRDAATVVLATNYLLWTPATRWMWETLGEELSRHGCQLVLLSTTLPEPPLPFPVGLHPYLLRDFAATFPDWATADGLEATAAELHWLRADRSRVASGYGLDQALLGLTAFRVYMRGLLERLQPGFLLVADNTLAQTALTQRLAQDAHLPVQIYERGLLPDTLMLESRGIQAWSDLRMHWLAQEMPSAEPTRFAEIEEYYRTRRPQKYPQPEAPGGAEGLRRQLGVQGKRLVVFLGGGYEANGHARNCRNYERNFFTGFPTTQEALMALWRVVEHQPDTALVFKPHPLDPDPYAAAKIEGVPVVRDVNVHTLIEAADVVAAQYTTLQFEAALYNKPVLLLARRCLVGAPSDLRSRWTGTVGGATAGSPRASSGAQDPGSGPGVSVLDNGFIPDRCCSRCTHASAFGRSGGLHRPSGHGQPRSVSGPGTLVANAGLARNTSGPAQHVSPYEGFVHGRTP